MAMFRAGVGGSTDGEVMDYPMMEEMVQLFNDASSEIQEAIDEMGTVATQLENGTLNGMTGDALVNALRTDLRTSLETLRDKMSELSTDVDQALRAKRDGIQRGRSRFL